MEVTERTDNAIKFLSDMFYARAYRLAAAKIGANTEVADLIDREPVLRKYALALAIRTGKRLDFGSTAVQNVDALIKRKRGLKALLTKVG